MSTPKPTFFYPNRMGRIVVSAMEEVLGQRGLNAVLDTANLSELIDTLPSDSEDSRFSFSVISHIQSALDELYGQRGGRGLALQIGRACFKYGLREYGSQLDLTEGAFRLLPLSTKLRVGGNSFANLFNKVTDQRVRFEERDGKFYWQIDVCPLCWERHTQQPACQMAVGLLQEALYWVSGGKIFDVEEVSCVACGAESCTILIDQTPMS
jgi:predicted hydrocarbon binding protein